MPKTYKGWRGQCPSTVGVGGATLRCHRLTDHKGLHKVVWTATAIEEYDSRHYFLRWKDGTDDGRNDAR